jgi:8-amino-7-oxononanoate synthase
LGPNGRGLAEASGVEDRVDFVLGTFSKSLGAVGGFCTSDHPELNLVRYASRPYVFTASSCPSTVASTRMALKLISRPEPRARLWNHAHRLYRRLKRLDLDVGPEASPIVCVRFQHAERAYAFWNGLLERGVYVNLVLPPATPDGGALLRCSLSAAHTREQVDTIGDAFASQAATSVERVD